MAGNGIEMERSGMTLTTAGLNLVAKAMAGAELKFTRAWMGDGYMPDGVQPYDMTALANPLLELPITDWEARGDGMAQIEFAVSNKNVQEGFFIREIGVFARDPETGAEVLHSYANSGDTPGYMPAGGGSWLISYDLILGVVVHRARNVTAVLVDDVSTTRKVRRYIDELFAERSSMTGLWSYAAEGERKLRPVPFEDLKSAVLEGLDVESINSLNRRLERVENNQAQVLLELEAQSIYPDYTCVLLENFRDDSQLDLYSCRVRSVVSGDDSLDCDPASGIQPGGFYTLSDGVSSEGVQVRSVSIENGIQRVILKAPVRNTYRLETCGLHRTSATISEGRARGSSGSANATWSPEVVWKGQGSGESFSIPLKTTLGGSGLFSVSGPVAFTPDGLVSIGG